MNTIRQAAERLEEMRRAGVSISPAQLAGEGLPPSDSGSAEMSPLPAEPRPVVRHSELARLDLIRLAREGYLVPGHSNQRLGDEFRVIKRPLILNAQKKGAQTLRHGNLIAVTSALAGEGKTYVATNLAMSIAMELDTSALLIEGDIFRPAVMSSLGLPRHRGLMDLLTDDKLDLTDVMLRTNISKLSLLPAGTKSPQSNELLASRRMEELLDELATRYSDRIIVLDAPPLLLTTEARVLASRVGQVLMVVESGSTTHAAVADAMATIEACPVVMAVLNKSRDPGAGAGYRHESVAAPKAKVQESFDDEDASPSI